VGKIQLNGSLINLDNLIYKQIGHPKEAKILYNNEIHSNFKLTRKIHRWYQ